MTKQVQAGQVEETRTVVVRLKWLTRFTRTIVLICWHFGFLATAGATAGLFLDAWAWLLVPAAEVFILGVVFAWCLWATPADLAAPGYPRPTAGIGLLLGCLAGVCWAVFAYLDRGEWALYLAVLLLLAGFLVAWRGLRYWPTGYAETPGRADRPTRR